MLSLVSWYLALQALALASLPVVLFVLRPLPDRGYLLSKPAGILLVGYLVWLPSVFGLVRHQPATIGMAMLAVGTAAWWRWGRDALSYLRSHWKMVAFSEALLAVCLAGAAAARAYNPEISDTEKPMDFAILNALIRTETLPPEDPWMSGHSISYYYFGYLLMATVAKLASVPASVGYNLAVATAFALLLTGCFSVAYNLISLLLPAISSRRKAGAALVAPVMVGIMGNLEIGLEVLATRGIGTPAFWSWVGIKGLTPAANPEGWFPSTHWWWWRASRVIPTTKPDGINEFPFFSFLLADLHPHFTALPWVLLAIGVALAVVLSRNSRGEGPLASWPDRGFAALVLGFFLAGNSWDFPTYTVLFWGAALLPLTSHEASREKILRAARVPAMVSTLSVALYAPFFLGFSSQTRGIGISADRTPFPSLLVIFGAFLAVLLPLLLWRIVHRDQPGERPGRSEIAWMALAGGLMGSAPFLNALPFLAGMAILAWRWYARVLRPSPGHAGETGLAAEGFLLILVALGLLLAIGPEFLFLADLFGTRMNTVFKLHYQAWVLLGTGAAVGLAWMVGWMRPASLRLLVSAGAALLVGVGLLYPFAALPAKARDFSSIPTLDGAAYYRAARPADYAAIEWLAKNAQDRPVVLEATGGEYSEYARVATFSGLPSVLGWAGHEVQWRGDGEEPQRRTLDIDAIYKNGDRNQMLAFLKGYNVEYVFVGSLEQEKYGAPVAQRFEGILEPAYRQGTVTVYRVPRQP